MSCSGRPPTNPPDSPPASPFAPSAAASSDADADLAGFAAFTGGRWIVPPSWQAGAYRRPLWLRSASNAEEAVALAGQCLGLALPEAAATTAVERAARDSGTGLLLHHWRSTVMGAAAAGWRRHTQPVMLPGGVVELGGHGLLITGPAGSGKSEAALGLIDRGHRLVADDAFLAGYHRQDGWTASADAGAGGRLAVRGLGILDVAVLFGGDTLADKASISLEVALDPNLKLSPSGLLAGERGPAMLPGVPCLRLPAQPGRNLPLLLETLVRQRA